MSNLEKSLEILKKDGIIIFPTETTLGIGCRLSAPGAIEKLYLIKGRQPSKPTSILVPNTQEARKYAYFDSRAEALTKAFWPGPLTLVLRAKAVVPATILGPGHTVGVRVPAHSFLLKLLLRLSEPLLAPSANFASGRAPLDPASVDRDLASMVDYVVDEKASGAQPSTVLDLTKETWTILRVGPVSLAQISSHLEESKVG